MSVFTFHQLICISVTYSNLFLNFIDWFFLRGREGQRDRQTDRHQFVVPLDYAFIRSFLYVPWLAMEPTTLAYRDNALNNWATWQGPEYLMSACAALAGVAQWFQCGPANQRVTSSIPSQGTCPGCRPCPQWGAWEATTHWCFSPSLSPSLLLSLKMNK